MTSVSGAGPLVCPARGLALSSHSSPQHVCVRPVSRADGPPFPLPSYACLAGKSFLGGIGSSSDPRYAAGVRSPPGSYRGWGECKGSELARASGDTAGYLLASPAAPSHTACISPHALSLGRGKFRRRCVGGGAAPRVLSSHHHKQAVRAGRSEQRAQSCMDALPGGSAPER
jgi:hypothetical protein